MLSRKLCTRYSQLRVTTRSFIHDSKKKKDTQPNKKTQKNTTNKKIPQKTLPPTKKKTTQMNNKNGETRKRKSIHTTMKFCHTKQQMETVALPKVNDLTEKRTSALLSNQ